MTTAKKQQEVFAFTTIFNGLALVLQTEIHFCEPSDMDRNGQDVMQMFPQAIWDTGASISVITEKVIKQLNLVPINQITVGTVNGSRKSDVYLVNIGLPNGVIIESVPVTQGDILGADALIGMDVISKGDFAVTNMGNQTVMTFRMPSIQCFDFVQQGKDLVRQGNAAKRNRRNHPTKRKRSRK